jgi:hypothetical protein
MGRPVLRTPLCDLLAQDNGSVEAWEKSGLAALPMGLQGQVREAVDVLTALSRTRVTFALA